MQGIFQKENTDKALKYGIYRHLPTYEKIIRNLVSFFLNKRGLLQKSLKNFCKNHHLLKQINLDNLIYIPVLAFGNENYEIFPEEIGFAHIYVKNLKECKIIYFGESGESEI